MKRSKVTDYAALKQRQKGYFNRLHPSLCLSIMLSPKPLDEIRPDLVYRLLA